jgi:hypothetical protein
MANYCAHCREKIGIFAESYNINTDIILCGKCASPIGKDFCDLYTVKTKVTFDNLKKRVCENAKKTYSEDLADIICESVKNIEDSRTYFEDIGEVNNPKKIEDVVQEVYKEVTVTQNRETENTDSKEIRNIVSGLYDNVGNKIKIIAKVTCWIGIIASIIGGLVCMGFGDELIPIGLVVIFGGSIFSWLGSLGIYAFGQLVENSDKLVKYAEERREK